MASWGHITNEVHQVAHYLARHAINVINVAIWTDTNPPFIIPYLQLFTN